MFFQKSEVAVGSMPEIYRSAGGETSLPAKSTVSFRTSRMKNKKGRSALNSIGDAFGDIDVQQRVMITAVAAAASDPRR